MKTLNVLAQFQHDAEMLRSARDTARNIRSTDIKAAGNHIEQGVRDWLQRMLPNKYYVTSGHLIDYNGNVSSQQDVIIADNSRISSLLTTHDGTEYVPITSVYAIGEIKSTYLHREKYYQRLHGALKDIASMKRPLIENTIYGDGEWTDETTFQDVVRGWTGSRYNNNLLSFLLCIDGGDSDPHKIEEFVSVTLHLSCPTYRSFLTGDFSSIWMNAIASSRATRMRSLITATDGGI